MNQESFFKKNGAGKTGSPHAKKKDSRHSTYTLQKS